MRYTLPTVLALTAAALLPAAPVSAQTRPSVAPRNMQAIAPALAGYTDDVLFGDVWLRPELSPRDRSMVTLSVLIATGRTAQLPGHLGRALTNGVKPTEIAGIVTRLAFYTGWPNAVSALNEIEKVFAERRIGPAALRAVPSATPTPPAPAADGAGDAAAVAPKFAALTRDVVDGDLWRRTDLSPRDRSLVTIAALAAGGDREQLAVQIRRGVANGLSRDQIGEALTHLAFYAGFAKAGAAITVAAGAFATPAGAPAATALEVIEPGRSPAAAPRTNFVGDAVVSSPFKGSGQARLGGATVTFRPGARTNWHSHPLGQLLIVTQGRGWVQAEGGPVREIAPGDAIWTAPGARHWHGATRNSGMTHVAVAEALDGKTVTWFEPVDEARYRAAR